MTTTLDRPPADTETERLDDIAQVSRTLRNNVIFCHVAVHRWRGQRLIEEAEVKTDGEHVDKRLVTDPRWKLLDDEWQKQFSKAETKIRSVINRVSPSFAIPGVYVIPRLKARELFVEVDRLIREQFNPLVDAFVKSWPKYVDELRGRATESQWAEIVKVLPSSPAALRRKFLVTKHIIPLAGSFDKELTGADADDFAEEITKATREFVRDTASMIATSLQDELNDAVDNLLNRINERGIVREGTLDMVRRSFEKLQSFSFVASPQVLARLSEAQKKLRSVDSQGLNDDNRRGDRSASVGLVEALKALRNESSKEAGLGSFGRRLRSIEA